MSRHRGLPVHHDPAWQAHLLGWAAWMRAAKRPESTLYLRLYHLRRLGRWSGARGPWELSTQDLAGFIAAHPWQKETARAWRASMRSFYGWALDTGLIERSPAAGLPIITPPRGRPRPAPAAALADALAAADERGRVMLLLGAHAGLRRAEIAAVHSRDVEVDVGGWTLRVLGKGEVTRRVPLADELARRLRELPAGWAFPSSRGGHLSAAHVGKLMSSWLPPGWTAHTLRHSFASRAYAVSHDLRAVQELLGHASPDTTARYTQVPTDALRLVVLRAVA